MKYLKSLTKNQTTALSNASKLTLSSIACLSLMACQSTSVMTGQLSEKNNLIQAKKAKSELQRSLNKQLRSSFNYQGNSHISNANRRHVLENATPEQLASADDVKNYCGYSHDNTYVELLRKVEQAESDVEDSQYDAQRDTLIDDYQACKKHYDQWRDNYDYEDNKAEYLPQGMDSYDDNHSAEDIKKANIRNTYLFNPLEIDISGTYQPLAGKFAVMPSFKYQSRNLLFRTQQPMFIDLKAKQIYLWADSFAYLNSSLLDDKLGTTWHNKWLSFSIKDDGLPKDFGKTFIKAYFKAMKVAYQQEPVSDFSYISANELSKKVPFLLPQQQQTIKAIKANHIINQVQTADVNAHQSYLFHKALYDTLNEAYPEFLEPADGGSDEFRKNLKDGEITKLFITQYLQFTNTLVKTYEDEHEDGSKVNNGYDTDGYVMADFSDDSAVQLVSNYGIKANKIVWMYQRTYLSKSLLSQSPTLPKKFSENLDANESMMMDTLITFSEVKDTPFNALPSAQMPNASNSIDAKEYAKDLLAYYDEGNGTSFGKIIYEGYTQYQEKKAKKVAVIEIEKAEKSKELESESNSDFESIQCVMMSVNLEIMCSEDDGFDQDNASELAVCQTEKAELQSAYEYVCK